MVVKGKAGSAQASAAKKRRASRAELNRKPFLTGAREEAEHLYRCDTCGEIVDRRRLGDVLHHEEPGHGSVGHEGQGAGPLTFIEPLLPTLVDEVPEGDGWMHEIKYDGYRTQIILADGEARAFTRRGHDWTDKYTPVVRCAETLPCASAIIEGEMIMQDSEGRSDFHALRAGIGREPQRLILMAFDLLHLDGRDLRRQPVERRRELLRRLLGPNEPHRPIHFSEHVIGNGSEFFAAAEGMGLEGVVSKKLGSRYKSGPSRAWVKTKSYGEEELVLIGTSKGDRAPVALLAREEEGGLSYAGGAMVTLAQPERDTFWQAAETIRAPEPPIAMEPRNHTGWVRPEMRLMVRTLRGEEMLRHATVVGITQLPEQQTSTAKASNAPKPISRKGAKEPHFVKPRLDGEAIASYYAQMASAILPWIANRPLNLLRCGNRTCWFQRNVNHPATDPGTFAPEIGRVPIRQKNGRTEDYLFVRGEPGLMACVAAGAVEFHGWGSLVEDVEKPDRMVIDLDPDEEIDFAAVRDAALSLRDAFTLLELKSFPLLSGGKGIHVVVPLTPAAGWDKVRSFAFEFCNALVQAEPERFTTALSKKERRGRIFLDYLRSQRTATAILPYSVRARAAMPIAAPVTWREVKTIESASAFTIADTGRLQKRARQQSLASWGCAQQRLL